MEKIIETANSKWIKVVLLTRPFAGRAHDKLWRKNYGPRYNEVTVEISKKHNISLADLCLTLKARKNILRVSLVLPRKVTRGQCA